MAISQGALEDTLIRIYVITNTVSFKTYVGQTNRSISIRFREHYSTKPKYSYLLHRALRKYGKENFSVELLSVAKSQKEADILEKLWIVTLGSHKSIWGYNISFGGGGVRLSKEESWKYGNGMRGKKRPPFSEEHRRNIGLARIGKPSYDRSKYPSTRGIPKGPMKEAVKQKISEARRGIKLKPFSESHKKSLSEMQKRVWSKKKRTNIRICYCCFNSFNPTYLEQVFCSESCSSKTNNLLRKL